MHCNWDSDPVSIVYLILRILSGDLIGSVRQILRIAGVSPREHRWGLDVDQSLMDRLFDAAGLHRMIRQMLRLYASHTCTSLSNGF